MFKVRDLFYKFKVFGLKNLVVAVYTEWIRRYFYLQPILGSYSQNTDDLQIDSLLNSKNNGFFVDVGAFDPVRYNNTYRFYLRGWRGINIEPNRNKYKVFLRKRPNDINLNYGIGNRNGTLTFYKFYPESLSTFSRSDADEYERAGFIVQSEEKVKVRKLSWVLYKYASNQKIDLLSIDTEGLELDVLAGNDWEKFRPLVVCIETFSAPGQLSKDAKKISNFLIKHNYRKYKDIGFNTIFIDKQKDLREVIKPKLRTGPKTNSIPNFLNKLDKNTTHQAKIWSEKTYKVNPKTHVFTTIQEHFGNRLIRSIKLPKGAIAVDIGCFIGEKLWQLSTHRDYLGVGVDISLPSLKIAKEIDIYGNKFIAADMENLPFKDNSVDFVIVFDVIEHLTHPEKGFSEVARILKPGGKLLLHIPIKDNKWSMFWWKQQLFPKEAKKDYDDVGHADERMLMSTQIKKYLKKYGLKLEKEIFYNSFFVHFWDREFAKIVGGIVLRLLGSKSSHKSYHPEPASTSGKTREIYGKLVVPALEFLSWPDWILSKFGIGNTYFCLSRK